MIRETVHALLACVVTFLVCAVAYPAVVYGVGHTLFPRQAGGSLIEVDGKVVGSELIAQPFASDRYFSPRPSAAGSTGYSADAASGSNLGTTNPALRDRIALDAARQIAARTGDSDLKATLDRFDAVSADLKTRKDIKEPNQADTDAITKLEADVATAQAAVLDRSAERGRPAEDQVPVDLVTTSGAGLDPDISPEAARYQAPRVATARGVSVARITKLIEARTAHSGAIIGAPPTVNVLLLNLDLDKEAPAKPAQAAASTETPPTTVAATVPAPPATTEIPALVEEKPGAPTAVETLIARVDRLQAQLDAAPIAAIAADMKDLKVKVASVSDSTAPVTKRLTELDARVTVLADRNGPRPAPKADPEVAALDMQVQALRSQIEAFRDSAKKDATAVRAVAATSPKLDLAPAIKLFREKRYAEASGAFRVLAETHPEDARTWYFAAISVGLTTGKWTGEVEALVKTGIDRERAGSPVTAEIDAAVVDLTRETGKDWLAYYRHHAGR